MLALQLAAPASRSSRQPARHPLGTLKNREVLTATPRFFCIEVFIATILLHFIFQLTLESINLIILVYFAHDRTEFGDIREFVSPDPVQAHLPGSHDKEIHAQMSQRMC